MQGLTDAELHSVYAARAVPASTRLHQYAAGADGMNRSAAWQHSNTQQQQQSLFQPLALQAPLYRSAHAFDGLQQPSLRAVAEAQAPMQHASWFASPERSLGSSFDAWGMTSKQHASTPAEVPHFSESLKELSLPQLLVQQPKQSIVLPLMPAFVEHTCFSLATQSCAAELMWQELQKHLTAHGVAVAQVDTFELACSVQSGLSNSEFVVRVFGGHWRGGVSAAVAYTVEFQRQSGCGMGFAQLFRQLLRDLSVVNGRALVLESKLPIQPAPAVPPIAAAAVPAFDFSGIDLSLLALPSLVCAPAASAPQGTESAMQCDSDVLDSLLCMIQSDAASSQLEGLQAACLCIDAAASNQELMQAAAAKVQDATCCEKVRSAAAKLIAQVAARTTAAATIMRLVLPALLALLAAAPQKVTAQGLDSALAATTTKSALQAVSALSAAAPAAFQATLSQSSAIDVFALRRSCLRLSAGPDADAVIRALSGAV